MPIYAYRCASCGHAKDVLQKISDPVLSTCPACGAADFKKQLTAAGFQLKGSGWYVTDFKGGASGGNGAAKTDTVKPDATPAPAAASEATAVSTSTSSGDSAAAGGCGTSCACH